MLVRKEKIILNFISLMQVIYSKLCQFSQMRNQKIRYEKDRFRSIKIRIVFGLSLARISVPVGDGVGLHVADDGRRKSAGNGDRVDAFLETI
jgi:hypothetical protein